MKNQPENYRRLLMAAVATASIGLAPFVPEPHPLGKVQWLLSGTSAMQLTDYVDLLLHASPWIWLIYELYQIRKAVA